VRLLPAFVFIVLGIGQSALGQTPPTSPLIQTSSSAGELAQTPRAVRDTQPLSKSVVRVLCKTRGSLGTGWVHTSGRVITAAHVVEGCQPTDVEVHLGNRAIKVVDLKADPFIDLAALETSERIPGGLRIGTGENVAVGDVLVTWGFPFGYVGLDAMVSVGYLAAVGPVQTPTKPVMRAFVNGAFNSGNSGGPVIELQGQTVVGVVHAKLAPLPEDVQAALLALQKQSSGFVYTATTPDGKKFEFSEAQVVSRVLDHLRSQTQLVIGISVLLGDLREFLTKHGIKP